MDAKPEIPSEIKDLLKTLCFKLDRRARRHFLLERYYEGLCPLPAAIVKARVTKAYRMLMPLAEAPWGSLIVDSTQDRLEVSGIDTGEKTVDDALWGAWQDNKMDAESKIAHNSTLIDGRSFALVWRPPESSGPEISLDDAATMIVQYEEGSRHKRTAALRRWMDGEGFPNATLYLPDKIYKFKGPKNSSGFAGTQWEQRFEIVSYGMLSDGSELELEEWPLENPYGEVPVVEIPINRRLKPGPWAFARGEYEHCMGLIDRISLLTFLGLVVAFWMGFPLRGVVGERILRDDNGEPIAPFKENADTTFQLEDPNAKLVEYQAADRSNLSISAELDQLSAITKTPRHYFPMPNGMANLAADAIRASEGALASKVYDYKASLGEGWEEVLRLSGLMLDEPITVSPRAELLWKDNESRSMAEMADAATKIASIGLPVELIAQKYLNFTPQEVEQLQAMRSNDVMSKLLAEAVKGAGDGAPAKPEADPVSPVDTPPVAV
jgi:hypothetical protein